MASKSAASEVEQKPAGKPTEKDAEAEQKKPPPPKTTPKYFIHSRRFLDAVVIIWGVCALGAARYFRPGFWSTIMYAMVGLPIGLALSFMFYIRKKEKAKVRQLYNVEPGAKGASMLLQHIPSWLTLSDTEKCEWLNAIILEMWPFYDYAVCTMIKEIVGPIFKSVALPGMSLDFAKFQFGDQPFRIEGVRMDRDRKDGVFLELDIRWAGDPEVKLDVGVKGAPKLQPKVTNLRLVATAGIHLRHLIDEIPGFGAVIVTLTKPPKISYNIDTGGVGVGKLVGNQVENFLATLLPNILNGFLVWPERVVVPIAPEDVQPPLTDLMLRHQGIIKVSVLEARDIPAADALTGKSDPIVEIFTDTKHKVKTAKRKNTLNPVWGDEETHYLMVQEPESQFLRFEMFDEDKINLAKAAKLNPIALVKGATEIFNSLETMSKGEMNLRSACIDNPGETIERWFPLGTDDWSADDGPGRDAGELKLRFCYVPLSRCNPLVGDYGALFVYVRKGRDFPRMVAASENSCNPYYAGRCGDLKDEVQPVYNTCTPDWGNAHLSFYNVPNSEEIRLKFKNKTTGIGLSDDDLGYVNIEVSAVRQSTDRQQRGRLVKEYEMQDADSGFVTIECLFVAYF